MVGVSIISRSRGSDLVPVYGRGVHHMSFPGIPSRSRANGTGNFPGAGNGTGSRIGPGNSIPVPNFNIVYFLKYFNKKYRCLLFSPIVNIAYWVLIASGIFFVVFFSKIYFHLTNLKELIAC